MKNRIRFAITLAGAVLCALPNLAMAQSGQNGDSQGGQAAPIEGTWVFSVLRVNTGFSFTALQSFTAGGVTLATGSGDRLPAPTMPPYSPPISPLYGSWRQTGDNSYVATLNIFAFDSSGKPAAMIQNILTFQLKDGNTITGTGTAYQCYVDGSNCMVLPPFAISFCGKRLTAGSLASAPAACPF